MNGVTISILPRQRHLQWEEKDLTTSVTYVLVIILVAEEAIGTHMDIFKTFNNFYCNIGVSKGISSTIYVLSELGKL